MQFVYSAGYINSVKIHLRSGHPDHYSEDVKRPTKKTKIEARITDAFCYLPKQEMKPAKKGDMKKAE